MWETWVRSLGWEDPLEKEMATHSSALAWKISWMGNLVGYSPWGRKESDMTEQLHFFHNDGIFVLNSFPSVCNFSYHFILLYSNLVFEFLFY